MRSMKKQTGISDPVNTRRKPASMRLSQRNDGPGPDKEQTDEH